MIHRLGFALCLLVFAAPTRAAEPVAAPVPPTRVSAGPRPSDALTDEIRRNDARFFEAFFIACDVDTVAAMVTDDFEFFHDKNGRNTTSGKQFVTDMRAMCERRRIGEDFTARRELVDGSLQVYPLNNYGAIEIGVHRFYRTYPDGRAEEPTEIAKFTQVWKRDGDTWRVARVLSYDHQPIAR
jgi:ketosteroid isomerase-like protein